MIVEAIMEQAVKANAIERLAKLNELRSSGALTDEEFELEKRKLLSRKSFYWPFVVAAGLAAVGTAAIVGTWISPRTKPIQHTSPLTPVATSPQTPASSSLTSTPLPRLVNRTPAERLRDAFEAATGHSREFAQTVKGEEFIVTPVKMVELPFGPALLVKREIKDGCHACSGYLGVYYLRENQGQFIVTASFPEALSGWGWGAAPSDWQITDRFTAAPAIYASGGFTGQGITESTATITELRPEGPITSDVIGTGYSDAGAITEDNPRAGCELEGKIANIRKDIGFDVLISGTISGKDHYVKRGGKFVALKTRDWGVPCPDNG